MNKEIIEHMYDKNIFENIEKITWLYTRIMITYTQVKWIKQFFKKLEIDYWQEKEYMLYLNKVK